MYKILLLAYTRRLPWLAALLVWVLSLMPHSGQAQVYYTLNDGQATTALDQLRRVNSDGTNDVLIKDNFIQIAGPAVLDAANNRILVADLRPSQASTSLTNAKIVAVSLATGNAVSTLVTAPAITGAASTTIGGIALDKVNNYVYYTLTDGSATASLDQLRRVNLNGTGDVLIKDNFIQTAGPLVLDAANNRVLVADVRVSQASTSLTNTKIVAVSLATGNAVSTLAIAPAITGAASTVINDLTLDNVNNYIYYTLTDGAATSSLDQLRRVGLNGTGDVLVKDNFVQTAGVVALDAANNRVLVADARSSQASTSLTNTKIVAVSLATGNAVSTLFTATAITGATSTTVNGITLLDQTAPTVTTAAATSITNNSAVLGGDVTADGGATVTERGVVYSTTNQTPTTSDTKNTNGSGTGSFSETITGLTSRTTYYVRAYAINSVGTSYGDVQSFTTPNSAPVVTTTSGTTTFIIGGGAVAIDNGITVTDADNTTLASASVRITSGLQSGQDVLVFSNTNTTTFGNIGSAASATGTLTLTSSGATATVAQFQAALRTVTFNNSVGTAPTTVRTVEFVVNDGTTPSAAATKTITFAPATTVVSVTRLTPSPTATTQVRYQVVFSRSVTGLTVSNFNTTNTGSVSGTGISSVVGSGTTYTVTVNTGTGSGTLRLNVNNSAGITPTVSGLPYTSGEVYTITKAFSNPVLTIQGTGGAGSDVTAFVDAVQVLSSGTAVANALQNGSFEIHDPLSNGNFGYQPTSASWTFNTRSGIAESGSAFTPTTPIPNGIAVAFIQSTVGNNGQIQQNLALPTGSSYQVNFQAAQRVCCTTLDQSLNVFLNGVFLGNIQPGPDGYTAFNSATFAVTAPALTATVSTTSASPTSTSPIPFSVSFSQSVGTSFDATDVTVTGGTLTSGSFAGSGPYTFTVTPSGSGTVSVSVAANKAQDANNTPNTASNTVSVQYDQPVTAAPLVFFPANDGIVSTTTPTYGGSAPINSTVTVYVDGSFIGTTTANVSGTFSLTQPTALGQGPHTVYARAQSSGASVSPNSPTNTFYVDSVQPTVAISSTATSPTSTSPIPVIVTFSEAVTGFVAGDVVVSNGTLNSFSGSGSTYFFTVTPASSGAVTVNVPFNVAQDQAGNPNAAAPPFLIFYNQTVTAAPVVTAPANGSLVGTTTPTYTGTALAGSTIQVYVDGAALSGTTTATSSGNWTFTQTTALTQGSHTVYATAQSSGQAVSANSNTNTFTVDTVRPGVTISSTAGASGTTTNASPIPVTVTFSESVTGFVQGDVTVSNGSISGFSGSGATYTFNVTPASNGTVMVNVPANVAQDAATNGNIAATQFSIIYSQLVTPAPVVVEPANGGLVNNNRPVYGGTAVANSTVTVYVDGSSVGTVTANSSGTWGLIQPTALAQGSHTVYATAQLSGLAVSANSNTNTFTVDSIPPTVLVTASGFTNGGSTSSSPILFAVSFAESVTGFVAGDVAVTNGSVSNFAGSGSGYTFNVTPAGNGTVTVTVPANVAQDAAGNGNITSGPFSFTYGQSVTATPVVTTPANGSLTNNNTPAYSGTAVASSTVTVYVDGSSIGTTTATGAGTFTLTQPTALANGSHTVYATAQFSGQAVSANSNTNTFTVDTVRPGVSISSTATSPTSSSPIPVTVTFSESVTGFVQGDVVVNNGSISGFAGAGATYTFNVTPSANGTVTVNVPANVAQDAATNGNTAATQFSIQYNAIVTATTWTGVTSTDWFTASNWTAGVPTSTVDAFINPGAARYPVIGSGAAATKDLILATNASLTQSGGTLQVTGAGFAIDGTFTATGGVVSLEGTSEQRLGGTRTAFYDLTVGSAGARLDGPVDIQRVLTLNGTLSTIARPLTLLSTSAGTAMVVNNNGATVAGTATVQRYIDPSLNPGLGYRHYSSPVQSTTVADLATSGFSPVVNPDYNTLGNTVNPFPTVYGYNEARIAGSDATTQTFEYGYFSPNSPGEVLTRGRGYTVNLAASEKVDLVGTLNSGDVAIGALTRGTQANSGWQLLGNPYPSPLDWKKARTALPTGVIDAVYVYKSSDQYGGTYQVYQNGFGTLPNGIIGSMQGFFIRVNQTVNSFSFLNAWRSTTGENPSFNRPTADLRPALQLDLVSSQGTHDPAF
ncbi:beta strand repeat-containing protein, partial [Hymenobacter chitinivorans]